MPTLVRIQYLPPLQGKTNGKTVGIKEVRSGGRMAMHLIRNQRLGEIPWGFKSSSLRYGYLYKKA